MDVCLQIDIAPKTTRVVKFTAIHQAPMQGKAMTVTARQAFGKIPFRLTDEPIQDIGGRNAMADQIHGVKPLALRQLAQKIPQAGHLARCSEEQYRTAFVRPKEFTDLREGSPDIAPHIFRTRNLPQPIQSINADMMALPIAEGTAENFSASFQNTLPKRTRRAARRTLLSLRHVTKPARISRQRITPRKACHFGTDLHASPTVAALPFIQYWTNFAGRLQMPIQRLKGTGLDACTARRT